MAPEKFPESRLAQRVWSSAGPGTSQADDHRHESSHDGRWQFVMLQSGPLRMGTSNPHLPDQAMRWSNSYSDAD
jgi:hypothetical protein